MNDEQLIANNPEFLKNHPNDVYVVRLAVIPAISNEIYNFLFYKTTSAGIWTDGYWIVALVTTASLSVIKLKYGINLKSATAVE